MTNAFVAHTDYHVKIELKKSEIIKEVFDCY